jgi:hypothetical protein
MIESLKLKEGKREMDGKCSPMLSNTDLKGVN